MLASVSQPLRLNVQTLTLANISFRTVFSRSIKMAMLRRYLTHRRREYSKAIRTFRAETIRYAATDAIRLNERDAKFVLTQPLELTGKALQLHLGVASSQSTISIPPLLIFGDALVRRALDIPGYRRSNTCSASIDSITFCRIYIDCWKSSQRDIPTLVREAFQVADRLRRRRMANLDLNDPSSVQAWRDLPKAEP